MLIIIIWSAEHIRTLTLQPMKYEKNERRKKGIILSWITIHKNLLAKYVLTNSDLGCSISN